MATHSTILTRKMHGQRSWRATVHWSHKDSDLTATEHKPCTAFSNKFLRILQNIKNTFEQYQQQVLNSTKVKGLSKRIQTLESNQPHIKSQALLTVSPLAYHLTFLRYGFLISKAGIAVVLWGHCKNQMIEYMCAALKHVHSNVPYRKSFIIQVDTLLLAVDINSLHFQYEPDLVIHF